MFTEKLYIIVKIGKQPKVYQQEIVYINYGKLITYVAIKTALNFNTGVFKMDNQQRFTYST